MTSRSAIRRRKVARSLARSCLLLPLFTSPTTLAQPAPASSGGGDETSDPNVSTAPVAPPPAPAPPTPSVSPDEASSSAPSPSPTPAEPPTSASSTPELAPPPAPATSPAAPSATAPNPATSEAREESAAGSSKRSVQTAGSANVAAPGALAATATSNELNPDALNGGSPDGDSPDGDSVEYAPSSTLQEDETTLTTVDRRSRDVQKVPHSVIVVGGEQLTRRGVTSIRELPAATPFVEVADQQGNIELYTRGLGDSDDRGLGDTSVATYIDGVYIPRARGFRPLFFDTERVEIAQGPQSTLWGRSAFAGTVHVISRPAKLGEWSADGSVQLGNYGQRLLRAAINAPLGDRIALRVAVLSERHEPFYQNRDGAPLLRAAEDTDRWAYRLSGRWEPTDNIAVTLRFDNSKERGTGVVGSNYTELLSRGVRPSEVPDPRATAFIGNQPSQSVDHWGVSANVEVDLGRVGLEVLSSYRSLTYDQHTGYNRANYPGSVAPALDSYTDTTSSTSSQTSSNEIRVFSPDSSRMRWMLGFFHFSESQSVFLGQVNDPTRDGRLGQELNLNDVPNGSVAGYVDTTTSVTDALRTIAGFRLTSEYRETTGIGGGFTLQCNPEALAEARTSDPTASCSMPGDDGARWGTPGFAFSKGNRSNYTPGSDADTLRGVASRVEAFSDGVETWGSRDDVAAFLEQPGADVGVELRERRGTLSTLLPDFRLGVEWDVGPQSLVYATFTSGHRRGGLDNDVATAGRSPLSTAYEPATLYATELGSKNALFDRRLLLNGAAFWYEQSNTQLAMVREFGAADAVSRENVGQSRVLGVSVDATGYLSHGFSANTSAVLLDARYLGATLTDPRVASAPRVDISGNFLPRAPQLALAYGLSQLIPTNIGHFDWSLSGQTKSTMYMTPFNGDGRDSAGSENLFLDDKVPWTTRVDAAVGYTRSEGDLRFDVFMTNLTNATYLTSLLATPSSNVRFFNPPRQFGLRLSMML